MAFTLKYPHLFEPIQIAGQLFRNRIMSAPTGFMDQDKEGMLPPEAAMYFAEKAKGGAAAVTVGGCLVDAELSVSQGYSVRLDNMYSGTPYSFHGLARVATEVNRYGAVCSGELQHAGMYANRYLTPPGRAYGPVECIDRDGRRIEKMPEEIIERTIRKYAEGASYLKRCGFGMVMVHAGHGWLLHQFLSPKLNTRKDKWGGPDIENRARFSIEVLDAIRRAVGPRFPIEIRISGSECYEGGYDLEEGIAFAKLLDGHADLIHVSAGSHEVEKVFTVTHPGIFQEDGCNVYLAAEIKKYVKQAKIATVGALTRPELMEDIIASGKADVIDIARGLMADPELPNKARAGEDDKINHCIRCLSCFSNEVATGHFKCAINPKFGDYIYKEEPAAKKKKVLIAGGGIAGMEAAIKCAERGHEVILCEKTDRMGGAIRCEENVPFKSLLRDYLEHQEKEVYAAGVTVRLNTAVTKELAEEIAPDAIIAALGARPAAPAIPGIDGKNVFSAEYIYDNPEKCGKKCVVLGAGLTGMEIAIYLAASGRNVTIVHRSGKVNDGGNFQHMKGISVELEKYRIPVYLNTVTEQITENSLICKNKDTGTKMVIETDTVIYATGYRPLTQETLSLSGCAPQFFAVGDCMIAKNIMNATTMAYTAACEI